MRFLILTQYYPPEIGAPQTRLHEMAKELQRQGHEISVVTAMPNYPKGQVFDGYRGKVLVSEELEGVRVLRTWIYGATGKNILKRLVCYFSFAFSAFAGIAKAGRHDYFFVESPPLFLGLTAYIASRLQGAKYVLNVSDLWPDSAKAMGFVSNPLFLKMSEVLEVFLYRKAAIVNAVSEGIADGIRAKGIPSAKVRFLPNGVNTDMFRPMAPDTSLVERLGVRGKKVFVFAGTHGYAQGLEIIVKAAELLRSRSDIAFLMVGDGPVRPELEAQCRQLGLNNVIFCGAQPLAAMPSYFSLATASIVPLRKLELFKGVRPSKIFPSLGSGRPVIFCGEGETAELIRSNRCGIINQPENAAELAESVERLAGSPSEAADMGERGRKLVQQHFAWPVIIQAWLRTI